MYRETLGSYTSTGLLTGALAALWVLVPASLEAQEPPQQQEQPQQQAQCEASFEPATIEAGSVHEEVQVSLSEEVGEIDEVQVDEQSGLNVLWTQDDDDDPTTASRVRVSAVGAEAGEWNVTFRGQQGNCEGTITVNEGR